MQRIDTSGGRKNEFGKPEFTTMAKKKKAQNKGEIEVDFQYVQPSEAYYHSVKALLAQYIDTTEADKVELMKLADHICERASIGQLVVSPLDADKDPEQMPEFQKLSDDEF